MPYFKKKLFLLFCLNFFLFPIPAKNGGALQRDFLSPNSIFVTETSPENTRFIISKEIPPFSVQLLNYFQRLAQTAQFQDKLGKVLQYMDDYGKESGFLVEKEVLCSKIMEGGFVSFPIDKMPTKPFFMLHSHPVLLLSEGKLWVSPVPSQNDLNGNNGQIIVWGDPNIGLYATLVDSQRIGDSPLTIDSLYRQGLITFFKIIKENSTYQFDWIPEQKVKKIVQNFHHDKGEVAYRLLQARILRLKKNLQIKCLTLSQEQLNHMLDAAIVKMREVGMDVTGIDLSKESYNKDPRQFMLEIADVNELRIRIAEVEVLINILEKKTSSSFLFWAIKKELEKFRQKTGNLLLEKKFSPLFETDAVLMTAA